MKPYDLVAEMDSLVQNMRPQLGSSHRIRAILSSILDQRKGACVPGYVSKQYGYGYPGTRYVRVPGAEIWRYWQAFSVPGYTNEDTVELRSELHLDLR